MKNKSLKEDCMICDKKYVMYSEGTFMGEWQWGKHSLAHSHIRTCKKCSKPLIKFIENYTKRGADENGK